MMDTMKNGEVKRVLPIYFDVPERVDISSSRKVTFVATCIVLFQIHDQSFSQRVFQRSKKNPLLHHWSGGCCSVRSKDLKLLDRGSLSSEKV